MDERSRIRWMYFLGVNRETPHFHHKTKIKFIFLVEMVILILGKNEQLFDERAKYIFSHIKTSFSFSYYNFCNFFSLRKNKK